MDPLVPEEGQLDGLGSLSASEPEAASERLRALEDLLDRLESHLGDPDQTGPAGH